MASADSHGWKNLLKTRRKVEVHIKWSIQNGSSSFWWDNWTSDGPLAHQVQGIRKSPKTQVKDFLTNGQWDINRLNQVLPSHITDFICRIDIGNDAEDDFPIWTLSDDGNVPQVESMQHVFVESEAAKHIWKNIGSPLGIVHPSAPIAAIFKNWWDAKTKNKIHGLVLQAAPTLICWEILKQRSSCRYGTQRKFHLNVMKHQVIWNLKSIVTKLMPNGDTPHHWPSLCYKIERLKPVQTWRQVQWHSPLHGKVKINTDECYIKESGKAGIGGIIRDEDGNCIMAFAMSIDCGSHNMAEARAAEFGGKWCNQLGLTNFVLELGSNIIVNMVNQDGKKNMKLKIVVDRITSLVQHANATVQHYYREGNQVADALAKIASISGTFDMPILRTTSSAFIMDKWQMLVSEQNMRRTIFLLVEFDVYIVMTVYW
ncbi:PREDICTED: uncharacterized protein LOC109238391 [Nicotiana attenuata]|uniref:uncharacterized protein LOC109238391 n=1 Tax=Nicotiana attenuata TaxID=49451 RepID=UPI000904BCD4|nr:PREDICTED: uncharacterized protein LOC109238391 [Nicotiana attenuata]